MYGERRPEFDPNEFFDSLRRGWERFSARLPGGGGGGLGTLIVAALVVIGLIWAALGFYIVGPGEQAAVRLFGEFRGVQDAGLKWYPPAPIGSRTIVNIEEVRQMEVGFRSGPDARPVMAESQMITGDLNIVDIQMVVQYRVSDVELFLFRVADPGENDRNIPAGRPDGRTLRDATEAALRQVVGQRSIDDALTRARAAVEADTLAFLQQLMTDYETGLTILAVQLQQINPPEPVQQAFNDVVAARLNREARINQALAYEQDQVPRAEGAAAQVRQGADAFRAAREAEARGEAAEFTSILAEYQNSPNVSRQRLYLESMQRLLPGVKIYVLDESGGVLPLLNIGDTATSTPTPGLAPTPTPGAGQ